MLNEDLSRVINLKLDAIKVDSLGTIDCAIIFYLASWITMLNAKILGAYYRFALFAKGAVSRTDRWLIRNKAERMDANRVDIFHRERAAFHLDRYRFACSYADGQRVLDIACGTGYGSALLLQAGHAKSVVGVEISAEAVDYARRIYPGPAFHVGSAAQIPLGDGSVDLVVSFETIEHVDDDEAFLVEAFRVLANDGLLVISAPNEWGLETSRFHVRDYTTDSLRETVSRHFAVNRQFNQNSGMMEQSLNRNQPKGIVPTTPANAELAEVSICVATKS